MNDLFDLGFQNDKLNLVYKASEHASIAVTTLTGISKRVSKRNTIMQETVWAGLSCTAKMDKLGKYMYENPHIAYKYRKEVVVSPLETVYDVLTISKCGATSIAMNKVVN